MASAELSRRVEEIVGYPPLVEMSDRQRREFHGALLDADSFEDLPGEVAGRDSRGGSGTAAAPRRHWARLTATQSVARTRCEGP